MQQEPELAHNTMRLASALYLFDQVQGVHRNFAGSSLMARDANGDHTLGFRTLGMLRGPKTKPPFLRMRFDVANTWPWAVRQGQRPSPQEDLSSSAHVLF